MPKWNGREVTIRPQRGCVGARGSSSQMSLETCLSDLSFWVASISTMRAWNSINVIAVLRNVFLMGLFVNATRRSLNPPYQDARVGINLRLTSFLPKASFSDGDRKSSLRESAESIKVVTLWDIITSGRDLRLEGNEMLEGRCTQLDLGRLPNEQLSLMQKWGGRCSI